MQEKPAVFAIDYTCCRDAHILFAHPPTPGPDPRSGGIGPVYMTNRKA